MKSYILRSLFLFLSALFVHAHRWKVVYVSSCLEIFTCSSLEVLFAFSMDISIKWSAYHIFTNAVLMFVLIVNRLVEFALSASSHSVIRLLWVSYPVIHIVTTLFFILIVTVTRRCFVNLIWKLLRKWKPIHAGQETWIDVYIILNHLDNGPVFM